MRLRTALTVYDTLRAPELSARDRCAINQRERARFYREAQPHESGVP